MTLKEWSDVLPIIQGGASVLGLASLILLWWQVWQTNRWHRLNSPHNFLNPSTNAEIERRVVEALKRITIDFRPRPHSNTGGN
jgi:hypothetical protein